MTKTHEDQIKAFQACKTTEEKTAFINAHPEYLLNMAKVNAMMTEILEPSMTSNTLVLAVGILERFEKRLEKLEALLKGPAQ